MFCRYISHIGVHSMIYIDMIGGTSKILLKIVMECEGRN